MASFARKTTNVAEQVDYSVFSKDRIVNILAVEDDILSMNFLQAQIMELGHEIMTAHNGEAALRLLHQHGNEIDVVLMDREMPIMDGLTTVRMMKDDAALRHIPVVMVTGADSLQEMKEGLDAGVFYYLTKPVEEDMLRSVLAAAVREAQQTRTLSEELGKHRTGFHLIQTCKFKFQTLSEAESLSAFIANCFPDPARVLPGLGELLINAVEHGNLGMGYDRKGELVERGTWRAEVERLQKLPEHQNKYAEAAIAHKEDGTYVVITDEGRGFAWKKYMQIDLSRAGDNHGRGIAQANALSFDRLAYNDTGNQAVAFVSKTKPLQW